MEDTIKVVDIKVEQKEKSIEFFENETRLPVSKVIEEMNCLALNKVSSKKEVNSIMHRLNNSPINHFARGNY